MHPALHARTNPDKPAHILAATGEAVTYAQLDARSNRGAHVFRTLDLHRGAVIALLLDNTARNLEIAWAAQRAGLYLTCISPKLAPADIAYILRDRGASPMVTSPALADYVVDGGSNTLPRYTLTTGAGDARYVSWETACAAMPGTPIADESPGGDMLYSSGTTGRPKGVKGVLPEGALA